MSSISQTPSGFDQDGVRLNEKVEEGQKAGKKGRTTKLKKTTASEVSQEALSAKPSSKKEELHNIKTKQEKHTAEAEKFQEVMHAYEPKELDELGKEPESWIVRQPSGPNPANAAFLYVNVRPFDKVDGLQFQRIDNYQNMSFAQKKAAVDKARDNIRMNEEAKYEPKKESQLPNRIGAWIICQNPDTKEHYLAIRALPGTKGIVRLRFQEYNDIDLDTKMETVYNAHTKTMQEVNTYRPKALSDLGTSEGSWVVCKSDQIGTSEYDLAIRTNRVSSGIVRIPMDEYLKLSLDDQKIAVYDTYASVMKQYDAHVTTFKDVIQERDAHVTAFKDVYEPKPDLKALGKEPGSWMVHEGPSGVVYLYENVRPYDEIDGLKFQKLENYNKMTPGQKKMAVEDARNNIRINEETKYEPKNKDQLPDRTGAWIICQNPETKENILAIRKRQGSEGIQEVPLREFDALSLDEKMKTVYAELSKVLKKK